MENKQTDEMQAVAFRLHKEGALNVRLTHVMYLVVHSEYFAWSGLPIALKSNLTPPPWTAIHST